MKAPLTETSEVPNPATLPVEESQREQGSSNDILGAVGDTFELGGALVDVAGLAVQAGGAIVEVGTVTVKTVVAGVEAIGGVFSALDGL